MQRILVKKELSLDDEVEPEHVMEYFFNKKKLIID